MNILLPWKQASQCFRMIYGLLTVYQNRLYSWVRDSTFHPSPTRVPTVVFQFRWRLRFWSKFPIIFIYHALICTTKWSQGVWPGFLQDEAELEDVLLGVHFMHTSCKRALRSWDELSHNIKPLKCVYCGCQALNINCYFFRSYLFILLNNVDVDEVTRLSRQA